MDEVIDFKKLDEEDIEVLKDIEQADKIRTEHNEQFLKFSKDEQVDYLVEMYAENENIIKKLGLKTINEEGDIDGSI